MSRFLTVLFCLSLLSSASMTNCIEKNGFNENLFAGSMKSKTLLEYEAIKSESVFFASKLNAQKKCKLLSCLSPRIYCMETDTKKKART